MIVRLYTETAEVDHRGTCENVLEWEIKAVSHDRKVSVRSPQELRSSSVWNLRIVKRRSHDSPFEKFYRHACFTSPLIDFFYIKMYGKHSAL